MKSRVPLVLSALAVAATALVVVSAPAQASVATTVSAPKPTASGRIAGERVGVGGVVSPRAARAVKLQVYASGRWKTVVSGRSSSKGRYRLAWTTPSSARRIRTVAPRTVVRGTVHRKGVSTARRLTPVAQSATLTGPDVVAQHSASRLLATFSPAREGRLVRFYERVGETWIVRASTTTNGKGRAGLNLPTTTRGASTWRATAAARRGAAAITTPQREVTVVRSALTGSVSVNGPVDASSVVRIDVDQPVTRAELFLDGAPIGDAVKSSATSWRLTWDARQVGNGQHTLTARLVDGARRGISRSAVVEVRHPADVAQATGLPEGFELSSSAGGFDTPTSFAMTGDTSALVAEKAGVVWAVNDGVRAPAPVIDLSDHVNTWGDRGLTGITVAPGFDGATQSGWLYLAYVYDDASLPEQDFSHTQRVTRVLVEDGVASGDEQVLVGSKLKANCAAPDTPDCMPTVGNGHNVDHLVFGPDGMLYVSVGDGVIYWGDRYENIRAQQLDVLAGKVLRIDPETGAGLPDNPFYAAGTPQANRNRVFARGFRNPFRIAFHPVTGELWAGDVGDGSWEELSQVDPGSNHGWPCYEGRAKVFESNPRPGCQPVYDAVAAGEQPVSWPTHAYAHEGLVGSITAGAFLTGNQWPATYRGRFVYGDYSFGEIRTVDLAAGNPDSTAAVFSSGDTAGAAVEFEIGPDGALWYLSIFPGELRRISYDAESSACPDGTFRAEWFVQEQPGGVPAATECRATVGEGETPDDLPDGHSSRWTGRIPLAGGTYRFTKSGVGTSLRVDGVPVASAPVRLAAGIHTVVLEQRDADAGDALGLGWAVQGAAPSISLSAPGPNNWVTSGSTTSYRVVASDAEDGNLAGSAVVEVDLLHYGESTPHVHPEQVLSAPTGSVHLTNDHAPGMSVFRLTARVEDSSGRSTRSAPVFVCMEGNEVGVCG